MSAPDLQLPSRFWAELSTEDFRTLRSSTSFQQAVAVLPVAAIEQHGPHLPLSVDTQILQALIEASLKHLKPAAPVLFLPIQAIGKSIEHTGFAGTLNLSTATLTSLWKEIGSGVAQAGISKLLLLNSHGGNAGLLDAVARDLRVEHHLKTIYTSWYQWPLPAAVQAQFSAHEHRFGVHGGEIETSLMLAIAPELVRMERAQNFPSTSEQRAKQFPVLGDGQSAKLGWHIHDYNEHGACGNAKAATAEKGQRLLDAAGEHLARLLEDITQWT